MAKIPSFKSINEARDYRSELVDKLERIELQLGTKRNERLIVGREAADDEAYEDWRRRAVAAKRHTLAEMRMTKDWIRREEDRMRDAELLSTDVDVSDPESLIRAAAGLLTRLQSEGVEFDEPERLLIYALRDRAREKAA